MTGYFTIFNGSDSQYYFNLKSAGNHKIVLQSEGYTTKQSCKNGIDSVKENSTFDSRYDRLISTNNQFYFNLKAANGEIIGRSELYTSSYSRDEGIETCKRLAPDGEVQDSTASNA